MLLAHRLNVYQHDIEKQETSSKKSNTKII